MENKKQQFQNILVQNISQKRKIALMPKIRIKNVSAELDMAKQLFSTKSDQNESNKDQLRSSIGKRVQFKDDNYDMSKNFSGEHTLKDSSLYKQNEDSRAFLCHFKDDVNEKELIKLETKKRLLEFQTIAEMNQSLFEPKFINNLKQKQRSHSKPQTPISDTFSIKTRSGTPQSKIQYSKLQIQLKRMQMMNEYKKNQDQNLYDTSFNSSNIQRPQTSLSTQYNQLFLRKRNSTPSQSNNRLDVQQIVYSNMMSRVPHTKEAFIKFYLLKKDNHKCPRQAFSYFQKDPVSSQEIMETREGSTILKSSYDNKVYIFGGRNIAPLPRLEQYDLETNAFKLIYHDYEHKIQGRFNHSMIQYENSLIFYGGQTGSASIKSKSQALKDMICYNIDTKEWTERIQNKLQPYSRRNHSAFQLNRFMVIFGGINEFNYQSSDTLIYDLDENFWITDIPIIDNQIQPLSHSRGHSAFYNQRNSDSMRTILNLKDIDWGNSSQLIQEEGFYIFGGLLSDGSASNDLWILKPFKDQLQWINGDKLCSGRKPKPRYSHSLTYFEKENSLIITGGRNDRGKFMHSDIYLLTLDRLNWIQIEIVGNGMMARADHFCVPGQNPDEFVILGGIDSNYQLTSKISFISFDTESLIEKQRQSPNGSKSQYRQPIQRLSFGQVQSFNN
eukprot:403375295